MNILLVKLSSLGDILHNLPMVWDIRKEYPKACITWVVEEAYLDLLTPLMMDSQSLGLDYIIPINLRRWKKEITKGKFLKVMQEFSVFKKILQNTKYDFVVETQGLIKSALVSQLARRVSNG